MDSSVSNMPKPGLTLRQVCQLALIIGMCGWSLIASATQDSDDRQNSQEIRESVKQFLIREATGLPGTVSVEVGNIDTRLKLASCAAMQSYLPSGSRLWGRINVGVRCSAPTPWSIYVPATIKVTGSYYVTSRAVSQGQALTESDIMAVQGDLSSLSSNIVTEPAQAVGRTSTMSLGTGIPLRQDSLRLQQIVLQGQTIRLISNGSGFRVSTEAQALNSASEGQLVKVKINSGQVLSGTAKPGGIVEVNN